MNIYELHLGSWKVNSDGAHGQLANELVDYIVSAAGYTFGNYALIRASLLLIVLGTIR